MESIDRTQKRKRDKQPTVSGVVVLLLISKQKLIKINKKTYWICNHTTIIKQLEGKEKRLPTIVKWDLTVLHEKIYKETNENLEVKLILHILLCKI
ncbi:hypothetical protein D8674_017239 [Pyrus ussuriensis x Pyrus communis]|uniref:Uncharacterized protein n=1 Tax=Pyrus ussuriensis x Pyrus communis TaxID=2448454 RepID=A0A5N5HC59_9ROSA|nr:hypothetical protein D8674_017239 [Pyrus ussuriensis x Pyrus communis]